MIILTACQAGWSLLVGFAGEAWMQQGGWLEALRFLGLGWLVVGSILIGLFLGLWLDQRVHTAPLFTILGLVLGVAAAARSTYRMIKQIRPPSQSSGQRARPRRGRR